MRIIQIIDNLDAGGAERMAVNYANALREKIDFSGLVVTRKEGDLKQQCHSDLPYLFLNKKNTFDTKALFRLKNFVKENKVTLVHAHSTSFFIAFLLKMLYPKVKLIWHDHYGNSDFLEKRPKQILKRVLPFFDGIISVNQNLRTWAETEFRTKNVIYLPNFAVLENNVQDETFLKGNPGKRIVSLANLRVQKNHFLLIEIAKRFQMSHPEWSFHLIGKDFQDDYSNAIKKLITESNLDNSVFIYDSRQDVQHILKQAEIAILTSSSEGLPVALLEYGLCKMPVVASNVGAISDLIVDGVTGFLTPSNEAELFYSKLKKLVENKEIQHEFGTKLFEKVQENYSEKGVINQYLNWLKSI